MRTRAGVVLLLLGLTGCTRENEAGWQPASAPLLELGVGSFRMLAQTDTRREVELGDAAHARIGVVMMTETDQERSVWAVLNGRAFGQTVRPDAGTMTLTLDQRVVEVKLNGAPPPPAALELVAEAKVLVDLVIFLGFDFGLLPVPAPTMPVPPAAPPEPVPAASPTPPPLCCSTVLVTTSGWAWSWEADPAKMACRRATDAANAACLASTQLGCCSLPPTCSDCTNVGTGTSCYTAGYLQYSCR
jgi:hypothetical protein